MRKPSGRIARGIIAAAVVSAGGIASVACNTALDVGDFKFGECPSAGALQCRENTPQVCGANGHWKDMPECVSKTCVDGVCTGECTSGDKLCRGNTLQVCGLKGEWQDETDCPYHCKDDQCTECKPHDSSCDEGSDTPRICNENGQWTNSGSACSNQNKVCVAGVCTGECAPGQKRCAEITPQQCDRNGAWQDETKCPHYCKDGQCTECKPGALSCDEDNNRPRICDESGRWRNRGSVCSEQTCVDGVCTGECAPGQKRCAGTTPQECARNGAWQDGELCDTGTHCSGGACVVTCTPGDLQCDGDQPQRCDGAGEWVNDGKACPPCVGCDDSTARCALMPKPDGATCTASDKCTLTAECQGGDCIPLSRVTCVTAEVCSPGICDPSTGSCAAPDRTPCEDGDACTMPSSCQAGVCTSSSPSSDRRWAHWNLRWDATTTEPSPRYICPSGPCGPTSTDHVVFDSVTHLTWQRKVPVAAYTWDSAKKYCDCLNGVSSPGISCDADKIPGYPLGWRLPTRIELASIVDYEHANPAIDEAAFPNTPSTWFWSSSSHAYLPSHAWYVHFHAGFVSSGDVGVTYRVRCVRGGRGI
ncbi:DUF1566 domain-containing protein [Sorangium sp. So ce542]|uniref:Lcl C-terminal domain-containing protein n=1 Tax=Sorangium sp. So ce542 TaxID=3133316 RepID=UPI003F6199C7